MPGVTWPRVGVITNDGIYWWDVIPTNDIDIRIESDGVTKNLCPWCWQESNCKKDGYDWCENCNAALIYLKHRPYENRNDL